MKSVVIERVRSILSKAATAPIAVIGDVMLDQFLWGRVSRISPEAPVPIVDFEKESFMPGGAANVAHNLVDLQIPTEVHSVVGADASGKTLSELLEVKGIRSRFQMSAGRQTSVKTRIVAHRQQLVRVDRESRGEIDAPLTHALIEGLKSIPGLAAVIVGDYGKGVVTQKLLNDLRHWCRPQGIWMSLDPKPVHRLDLSGMSLLTPNRKEAFELAGVEESGRYRNAAPFDDADLMKVATSLLSTLRPAILLITLGDQGMLLCQRDQKMVHIPTVAQEVFDVSGAGDTVIASFTAAIAGGASPFEATVLSNHAAGVVVGKVGTATVTPEELLNSFQQQGNR